MVIVIIVDSIRIIDVVRYSVECLGDIFKRLLAWEVAVINVP